MKKKQHKIFLTLKGMFMYHIYGFNTFSDCFLHKLLHHCDMEADSGDFLLL